MRCHRRTRSVVNELRSSIKNFQKSCFFEYTSLKLVEEEDEEEEEEEEEEKEVIKMKIH